MSRRSLVFAAAALLGLLGAPRPASSTWLHCMARTAGPQGAVAYVSTVANVGPVTPPRLVTLRQHLAAYVAKADPDARNPQIQCYGFDDQLAASAHYSKLLNAVALRMGWEHVVVVNPQAWLPAGDIVDDPSQP